MADGACSALRPESRDCLYWESGAKRSALLDLQPPPMRGTDMAETTKTRSARETDLLERARQRLPGGVLGTARYADTVAFVVKHGKGSKIYDVSGREYIDYVLAS